MKNLTIEHILTACHGTFYGDKSIFPREVAGVTIDSRKIEKDYLFIPVVGARADGHDFIPQVMEAGALCTLSEHPLDAAVHPYILVDSCLQALKDIAMYYRMSLDIKVVGITGSVGKTSTKEMIASVLEQKYHVLKTEGNFNNEIGLPLTIFRLTEEHEIAILEMGINQFGEMHRLSKIARPDICVMTNIGDCHLEFLKSRDGVLEAKAEMFDFRNPKGSIILNGEDAHLSSLQEVQGTKPWFFGMSNSKDAHADDITPLGLKGTRCTFHLPEGSFTATIPIPGAHMVYNALAGISVGHELGLTMEEMKRGIENLVPVSGRNNIIETNALTIIDDCYNANPISMKASLDVLSFALGRKIAILGDMGELGEHELSLHYQVGVHAGHCPIDVVVCIGPRSAQILEGAKSTASSAALYHFADKETFLADMGAIIKRGDTLLVKASHAMDFPVIVEALREVTYEV